MMCLGLRVVFLRPASGMSIVAQNPVRKTPSSLPAQTVLKPVELPPGVKPDLIVTADDLKLGGFFLWDVATKHLAGKSSLAVAKCVATLKLECPALATQEREFGRRGCVGDQIKFPPEKSWGVTGKGARTKAGDEFVVLGQDDSHSKERQARLTAEIEGVLALTATNGDKLTRRATDLVTGYIRQAKAIGPGFMKDQVTKLAELLAAQPKDDPGSKG